MSQTMDFIMGIGGYIIIIVFEIYLLFRFIKWIIITLTTNKKNDLEKQVKEIQKEQNTQYKESIKNLEKDIKEMKK